jgi:Leucine-rich repeat (LRR) protein
MNTPFNRLSALPKLKELKLYDNKLSSVEGLPAAVPALHTLDVSGNRLTSLQARSVNEIGLSIDYATIFNPIVA